MVKKTKKKDWKKYVCKNHKDDCDDKGFFGRVLFIVGVLIVLTKLGYLDGISIWYQILIGVGFSLMRF